MNTGNINWIFGFSAAEHQFQSVHTVASALFPSICVPQVCQSSGYFELQVVSVENPRGQLLSGACCDSEGAVADGNCGPDECDTYFRVCLKEYQQEVKAGGPCTYGSEFTKVIGGNTFQFRGGQRATGKIVIPFQFSWPVSGSWHGS